ncbi:hypothetical protein HDE_03918 [Halotydeus destructor]|nr:hypothetical protein HDE_03918 [Halotydeus destructor]
MVSATILKLLCSYFLICVERYKGNCGGSCDCSTKITEFGQNETVVSCRQSTIELKPTLLEIHSLTLNDSFHHFVPLAIDEAQRRSATELVFKNVMIAERKKPAKSLSPLTEPYDASVKSLIITNSVEPETWDWKQLGTSTIRTIRIDHCSLSLKLLEKFFPDYKVVLTRNLLEKISGQRITSLSVTNSKLSQVDDLALKSSSGLRILSLANNQLTSFSAEIFGTVMQSLWSVDLSKNQLDHLDTELFEYLPNLTHLKLDQNRFTALEGGVNAHWPNLKELQLNNNPLVCENICWTFEVRHKPQLFSMATCFLLENEKSRNVVSQEVRTACVALKHEPITLAAGLLGSPWLGRAMAAQF